MLGADAMAKCLEAEGVEAVFGYPGVAICPFFNSMLSVDIKRVLVRTEQNAAHAASGYARVSGKPGVCVATSGPGATNLITGIATAYADSIPLVCITGQVNSSLLGSDVFQEADITGAAESFVKYSYLVRNADDIPRIFKEAFHIASTGRKGPVLIDVPIDIQNSTITKFKYPDEINLRTYKPTVKGHAVQIKKVVKALSKAKKPIICAGGGVILSGAISQLRDFSHRYNIPVVSTMMGLSAMPTNDPLFFGMVGNNGKSYANRAMNEADVIMMIGARVADRAISQPDLIIDNKILIHIDVDPAEIGKNVGPSIPLVGDIKAIFEDFDKYTINGDYSEWISCLDEYKKIAPVRKSPRDGFVDPAVFIEKLSLKLSEDAVYIADVGQNQMWSAGYNIVRNGLFLTSGGMGTMGYSVPAAIGARMADSKRQIVAVCGDGSFQMSMMELATMQQHKLPVKIIIFNNGYLGLVREYQFYTYNANYSVVDLSGSPDFCRLASAYDIPCIKAENMEGIDEIIDSFLNIDGPAIMDVNIDPLDVVK
ncbi:MAG: biosynthetic-type acetolactate synthase large subunit [Lachnospiraceae bacterium]|nr:biosynthetic-type acetolactate synthase large subunit [Lachnospiraceae bacterium]